MVATQTRHSLSYILNDEVREKDYKRSRTALSYWNTVLGSKKYVCKVCDKIFGQVSNLNKHMKVVHFKLKPWPCPLVTCIKMFAQRSVARKHFESVHIGKKPFLCVYCGKWFSDKSNQKKHERLVHRKERNHACSLCPKRFGERRSMTDHVDSVHKKLKPHACPFIECDAKFGQKSHLSTHTKKKHFPQ